MVLIPYYGRAGLPRDSACNVKAEADLESLERELQF
jgi:hypothetical protein